MESGCFPVFGKHKLRKHFPDKREDRWEIRSTQNSLRVFWTTLPQPKVVGALSLSSPRHEETKLSFGNQPSLSQVIKDDGREYLDVYEPNQYHRKHDMLVLRFQILHSLGIAVYVVGNLLEQPNSKEFTGLWVVVADDDNLKRDVTTKLLQNLVLESRRNSTWFDCLIRLSIA